MNLLVTGGAGFIGSNFVHHWLAQHPNDNVVVYDALTYAGHESNLEQVRSDISFIKGDIRDFDLVVKTLKTHNISTVVNFAAESHNSLAIVDPTKFFLTNVMGTQSLLEASRHQMVERFHHVSTCEVYGDLALDSNEVFTEISPYRPRTPYSASKAGADHAVRAYGYTYSLPITITNCSNNYGPFQLPEKLIPLFITKAIQDQKLPLYSSLHNKREWLHVKDHCRAIELVVLEGTIGQTYLVGSGFEASIDEIADKILEISHKSKELKTIVQDRPSHDRRYLLDSTKIKTELGWSPTIDFESGLKQTVQWYEKRRDWWEPLLESLPIIEQNWSLLKTN